MINFLTLFLTISMHTQPFIILQPLTTGSSLVPLNLLASSNPSPLALPVITTVFILLSLFNYIFPSWLPTFGISPVIFN